MSRDVDDFILEQFPSQRERLTDPVERREFLRLMGASLALAGIGGCTKQPPEKIYPYAARPEYLIPGKPRYFATSMVLGGSATGLLVESHMNRPTKIEGNPDHPASLGSSDALAQAQIHTLYDPDRSETILRNGRISAWDRFLEEQRAQVGQLAEGEGLAILTEPINSPTLDRQLAEALRKLPKARWYTWTPVHRDNERAGALLAFGRDVAPRCRFDRAKVVLSIDADFLTNVRYARDFSTARRARGASTAMNRLYQVESSVSITGAMADHRETGTPAEVENIARAIAKELGVRAKTAGEASTFARAVARDLAANKGASLVVAGPWCSPAVHALVHRMNAVLDNTPRTVDYVEPPAAQPDACVASVTELVKNMNSGQVKALIMLGGNPVYDAPAELDFTAALKRVPWRAHLAAYEDETSELCHWHVPEAHFLESWSDARAYDGRPSIVQPLIAPLFNGKTAHDVLAPLAGKPGQSAHDAVKEPFGGDEAAWQRAVHDGVFGAAGARVPVRAKEPDVYGPAPSSTVTAVVFRPDASAHDGRFANNAWLQETPRPLTRLVWDNAALIGKATAKRLGVETFDVVDLKVGDRAVEAPAWVTEGHPEGVVTLHLGYGRRKAGRIGSGIGANANAVRAGGAWSADVSVRTTDARRSLVSVQDHAKMEGRDIVRHATFDAFRKDRKLFETHAPEHDPNDLSLYPEWPYDGNKWGMVIDLNACTGCNACMVACQSENNIPVVGKQQVGIGREMHWIRIDRYVEGDETLHQPVPCMQCERAPCELVCPVGATVHSDEGLNDMVYNRCVGTRYCANNCPYKVRRFNFFNYPQRAGQEEVKKLGNNPDVTIRHRGIMEKCTYCVQRISAARIESKKNGQELVAGDAVQSACQQSCPTQAIFFGNLNDKTSEVAKLTNEPHHYALMAELGTKPRTTYLAKFRNPNPELA